MGYNFGVNNTDIGCCCFSYSIHFNTQKDDKISKVFLNYLFIPNPVSDIILYDRL